MFMIKCFLSYSSKDKEYYIDKFVENILNKQSISIDYLSFEPNVDIWNQIEEHIDTASIFIFFISKHSLESDWIKKEVQYAKNNLDQKILSKIYPIIIDKDIVSNDDRIPEWMRKEINLQPIDSPKIAAKKINSKLIELSWNIHPRRKERKELFVGRNNLIKEIEDRLGNFEIESPIALIASGLPSIGRKSLLEHALRKAQIIKGAYQFIHIVLEEQNNIEDFIIKICDSGIYSLNNDENDVILGGKLTDKVDLAKKVIQQVLIKNEIILIEDKAVLIQRNGHIIDWFVEILDSINSIRKLAFCIATQFRTDRSLNQKNTSIFSVSVPELEDIEKKGLFGRYAKFNGIDIHTLEPDEQQFFLSLLTGYPEQIIFAVDQIKNEGIFNAKKKSNLIKDYAANKAAIVFNAYQDNKKMQDFIIFLSKFEFISYEVLFDLINDEFEDKYQIMLEDLITNSICENIGKASEYIRLNAVIRDYVSRNSFVLVPKFENAIKKYAENFIDKYQNDDFDLSGYLIAAQEYLLNINNNLSSTLLHKSILLPSIFISVIKKLYSKRNYEEVVSLSNRVLVNEDYLHKTTINYIRFLKCQSLARLKNHNDFFQEVNKIDDQGDKEFLIGFFYRIQEKSTNAERYLKMALERKNKDPKIIGELIRVYMQIENYDQALNLAKINYINKNRGLNVINANDYFMCTLMLDVDRSKKAILQDIMERLSLNSSVRAQEIVYSMRARLLFFYDRRIDESFDIIDEAIATFPDNLYPLLTKADLAMYNKDSSKLKETLVILENKIQENNHQYRTYIKFKTYLLAMEGKKDDAMELIDEKIADDYQKERFKARLNNI